MGLISWFKSFFSVQKIKYPDGYECWYKTGELVYTKSSGGNKYFWKNSKFHSEGGPAIIYANGTKKWMQNNITHREDGPAVEYADGRKEWWYEGEPLPSYIQTVEQFKSYIRNKILW